VRNQFAWSRSPYNHYVIGRVSVLGVDVHDFHLPNVTLMPPIVCLNQLINNDMMHSHTDGVSPLITELVTMEERPLPSSMVPGVDGRGRVRLATERGAYSCVGRKNNKIIFL